MKNKVYLAGGKVAFFCSEQKSRLSVRLSSSIVLCSSIHLLCVQGPWQICISILECLSVCECSWSSLLCCPCYPLSCFALACFAQVCCALSVASTNLLALCVFPTKNRGGGGTKTKKKSSPNPIQSCPVLLCSVSAPAGKNETSGKKKCLCTHTC